MMVCDVVIFKLVTSCMSYFDGNNCVFQISYYDGYVTDNGCVLKWVHVECDFELVHIACILE